jgi:hypothetical protein
MSSDLKGIVLVCILVVFVHSKNSVTSNSYDEYSVEDDNLEKYDYLEDEDLTVLNGSNQSAWNMTYFNSSDSKVESELFALNKSVLVTGSNNETYVVYDYGYNDEEEDNYDDQENLNSNLGNVTYDLSRWKPITDFNSSDWTFEFIFPNILAYSLLRNKSLQIAIYGFILAVVVWLLLLLVSRMYQYVTYKIIKASEICNKANSMIAKKESTYRFIKADGDSNDSVI